MRDLLVFPDLATALQTILIYTLIAIIAGFWLYQFLRWFGVGQAPDDIHAEVAEEQHRQGLS